MKTIAVFCGSKMGASDLYEKATIDFVTAVSQLPMTLVYGGADMGLMKTLADQALKHCLNTIGVMPKNSRTNNHTKRAR